MVKRTLVAMVAAALCLGGASAARAQAAKPLVTVAFSGYDELKRDLAMVGELGGQPQLADAMEALLTMMTQGRGLKGLDKGRPWGLVVQTKGDQFPVSGFIPVTNVQDLFTTLAQPPLGIPAEDRGGGVFELALPNGPPIVVKTQGNWALVAPSVDMLAELPTDPVGLLGGLHKEYDLAVQASIANIPEQYKQMFVGMLQMGMQSANRRQPGESDEVYAMRINAARMNMQQVITLVKDLEEITWGLAIDQATKTAHLDMRLVATADSATAEKFNAMKTTTTQFAGFDQPGATMTLHQAGTIAESDLAQTKIMLKAARGSALSSVKEQNLGEDEQAIAQQILNDLFDVLDKTVDARKIDVGATVMIESDGITVAAGGSIVDAAKLETILKQLVAEVAKDDPDAAKLVKFDVAKHDGIALHQVSIPLPVDDEPELAAFAEKVGNPLTVTLGIGKDTVLVAAGKNSVALLEKIIDKSKAEAGKSVGPSRMVVHVEPIAKLIADLADDEPQVQQVASKIAQELAGKSDKDTLVITNTSIPNGAQVRIEVGEAILALPPMISAMGPGGPGGPPPGM